jgi:hypothetical protein
MAGKIFRMIAAFTMLVLYTTVMAASDVVALTCHCNTHRGDVHTSFQHVHKCEAEHCDHHYISHCEDTAQQQFSKNRCCNHNHSNKIALYIQPRTSDDDHSQRQSILLAIVTDVFDYNVKQETGVGGEEYGECVLPSLLEGYTCSGALRAPPALV